MMKLTQEQIGRIKMLENEKGQLTPAAVVADARRDDSPLRSLFDWDKDKAAEAHWLDHARAIIRTVRIQITVNETTFKAPYYTRDPEVDGQGYRSVVALQSDPEQSREAVIAELTRAAGNLTRARSLATALGMSDEIDELLAHITGLQRMLTPEVVSESSEARPS